MESNLGRATRSQRQRLNIQIVGTISMIMPTIGLVRDSVLTEPELVLHQPLDASRQLLQLHLSEER